LHLHYFQGSFAQPMPSTDPNELIKP